LGRSFTGVVMLQPLPVNTASVIFIRHEISVAILFQGASAPCLMLLDRSGITRPGSITSCVPRPVQVGQAPWGELNENDRGSSSSIIVPSYGHE